MPSILSPACSTPNQDTHLAGPLHTLRTIQEALAWGLGFPQVTVRLWAPRIRTKELIHLLLSEPHLFCRKGHSEL